MTSNARLAQPSRHMSALEANCFGWVRTETMIWTAPQAFADEREAVYDSVTKILNARQYSRLDRRQKGIVRAFLIETTGYSRAQLTRLIAQWAKFRRLAVNRSDRWRFPTRYTTSDIALLAELDAVHQDLPGPAVKHILAREYHLFGKAEYERLARLSVSHIYNLRRSTEYQHLRAWVQHEPSQMLRLGRNLKPDARREPGYLSIRLVRAYSENELSGYQICAIDGATKWRVLGCAESLREVHFSPVLEAVLHQFPFQIRGLRSELGIANFDPPTPSIEMRARSDAFQRALTAHLNPYVNYHRPCAFTALERPSTSDRGPRRRTCYLTPYERLVSLSNWQTFLKPGITPLLLKRVSSRMSDTESARQMQHASLVLTPVHDLEPEVLSRTLLLDLPNGSCPPARNRNNNHGPGTNNS